MTPVTEVYDVERVRRNLELIRDRAEVDQTRKGRMIYLDELNSAIASLDICANEKTALVIVSKRGAVDAVHVLRGSAELLAEAAGHRLMQVCKKLAGSNDRPWTSEKIDSVLAAGHYDGGDWNVRVYCPKLGAA